MKKIDRVHTKDGSKVVYGKAMTETRDIEMGRMKIVFLSPIGEPVVSPAKKKSFLWPKKDKYGIEAFEPITTNRWVLYVDGEMQKYVKSVEIPKLDYSVSAPLTVKVEYYTDVITKIGE